MARRKTHEEFVAEVKALVGDEYTVVGTYVNAKTRVRVRHNSCGEVNTMFPTSILSGKKCFKCFGSHRKSHSKYIKDVYTKYGHLIRIKSEYISARNAVEVECLLCGHTRSATAQNILNGDGCPTCHESKGERRIRGFLEHIGVPFTPQKHLMNCGKTNPLKFDFFTSGVAIEYDGIQHYKPVEIFGGEVRFKKQKKLDVIKDKYCVDNGIPLIRIPYWEYDNIDAILTEKLLPLLKERAA